MEWVLLVVVVLSLPFAGIAALILVLRLRNRVELLEGRLAALAAGGASLTPLAQISPEAAPITPISPLAPAPEMAATATPAPPSVDDQAPPIEASSDPLPPLPPATVPPVSPRPPRSPGRLEDRLGSRWAVWVGGVALALGAVLMVRYSIEQGYFGPAARIAVAALLAAVLIGAGEWARRRELGRPEPEHLNAYVPGVLTAAGTVAAFATAYGAFALYGFVGPAAAFVLLGAIAFGTMAAAALHGPALAGLGLIGALATPIMVSSGDPQPWPLVIYLGFVVAAAYALARLRLWRWLALAAAVGASLWGLLLIIAGGSEQLAPIAVHVLAQTVLAGLFLVAEPHWRSPESEATPDWFALPVLAVLAVLGVLAADIPLDGSGRAAIASVIVLVHLALALRFPAVSGAALLAAFVGAATLSLWPIAQLAAGEETAVVPGAAGRVPLPDALLAYLTFAALTGAAILGGCFWKLRRHPELKLSTALPYIAAMTGGPGLLLVASYWRVTAFDTSLPFAVAAGALALLLALAASVFKRQMPPSPVSHAALAASAAASVAALSLGLTFSLSQGTLTVSFAVTALATAWIARRLDVPSLRYAVGALGILVLGRFIWDPVLVGADLGTTPFFNWLLWGYGVPALCFFGASRLLADGRRDAVAVLCEALALLFAFGLVFFEVRHAFHGGDPLAPEWGLAEAGIITAAALAFATLLARPSGLDDPVRRFGSVAFAGIAAFLAFDQLLTAANPLLEGPDVVGGAMLNTLLPGYLLPALFAFALAHRLRAHIQAGWGRAALVAGLLLQFVYVIAEVRRLFHGPDIALVHETGSAELWTYSLVLLLMGVLALAVGLVRDIRLARLISAVYVTAAVLKVFLVDLATLEGMLRALSFIGLGVVLVGIGLAYQKLLIRTPPPAERPAEGGEHESGLA